MLGRMQKLIGLSIEQSGIRYVRLAKKTKDIEKHFFFLLSRVSWKKIRFETGTLSTHS